MAAASSPAATSTWQRLAPLLLPHLLFLRLLPLHALLLLQPRLLRPPLLLLLMLCPPAAQSVHPVLHLQKLHQQQPPPLLVLMTLLLAVVLLLVLLVPVLHGLNVPLAAAGTASLLVLAWLAALLPILQQHTSQ
jgi:hypothetical protein